MMWGGYVWHRIKYRACWVEWSRLVVEYQGRLMQYSLCGDKIDSCTGWHMFLYCKSLAIQCQKSQKEWCMCNGERMGLEILLCS